MTDTQKKKQGIGWLIPVLTAVLLLVLTFKVLNPTEPVHLEKDGWHFDAQQALASATEDKPVLAVFTADWCPPCQVLKKNVFQDPAIMAELPDNVVLLYEDQTEGQSPLGAAYDVSGIPEMILLDPEGDVIARRVGAMSAETFAAWLGEYVDVNKTEQGTPEGEGVVEETQA